MSWWTPQGRVYSNVGNREVRWYTCRFCGATPGQRCVGPTGISASLHSDRIKQWDDDNRPIRGAR